MAAHFSLLGASALAALVGCGESVATATDAAAEAARFDGSSDGGSADVQGDEPAAAHLTLDTSAVTVSGLSSGGFMAVQFHVAFSSFVKGAAIFAGGPYMCSKGSFTAAFSSCMAAVSPPDVAASVGATNASAQVGAIDSPSGLATARVFLFGGADDVVVSPLVMDALDAYYAAFVPSGAIEYVDRKPSTSHTWPTLDYGSACDAASSPFVGKCNYDGAGAALAQLYGTLAPPSASAAGNIVRISQGAFVANPAQHSLDDTAFAYVPVACAAGETCRLHVSFHGCSQSASLVGDAFYAHAGLNEWADSNHIVVLYPQTIGSLLNPQGCWDFWGYDSPNFATKAAPQMAMVRAMIDALAN